MDLTFEGVAVMLGKRVVLSGVDVRFRPGRVTAIVGPNGAGKSTLLKAAAALVPLAAGTVRLGGGVVAALDPRARARAVGYLPQEAAVHWNMRARDLVALGRLPHRGPFAAASDQDDAAIARAMRATDTEAFADRPVGELSGGERARVLLARVLAGEPAWLLADEPLASLDPAHQADLLGRLRRVAGEGGGVGLVLHDLVHAQRAADDVLLLDRSRVVAFGSPDEVLTPANLQAVFGVRVVAASDNGRDFWVPVGR